MFSLIAQYTDSIRLDSVIVEKRKTGPSLQVDRRFYPRMMGYLLRYVFQGHNLQEFGGVTVVADRIPVNRKRQAVEKAVKVTLAAMLPPEAPYRIVHHAAKAHPGLQIVDYCSWAIYRKWSRGDSSYYGTIKRAIRSEFDIFRTGRVFYY